MKLVAYTDATEYGGAEIVLGILLAGLSPEIEVTVVGVDADIVARVAGRRDGARTVVVPRAGSRWSSPADVCRHWAAFRKLDPDVVHVNLRSPDACASALLAVLPLRRARTVGVEHLPYPFGGRLRRALARALFRRLDALVATSVASARELELYVGLPIGSVLAIPNGVPAAPARAPRAVAGRTIGVVARLDVQKGIDTLLHALPALPDATVTIVGDGPERSRLGALATELDIGDRVRFSGWLDDPLDGDPFDVLVLPSRLESFPLALLEAMHAGVPVVATRVGGIPEMLVDGVTGSLVPAGDAVSLARAIRRVLDDPAAAQAAAVRAREAARERFTDTVMREGYERVYEPAPDAEQDRPRPLRLLVYTDATVWGGAEEVVGSVLAGLSANVEVVVVGVEPRVLEKVAARRPGTATLTVSPLRSRYDVIRLAKLVRVIRRARADVVHVNMRGPYLTQHGELAALLARRPVVSVEHSLLPARSRAQRVLKRFTSRRLAAHLTVSAASASWLERATGRPPGTVRTIYNGVWPRAASRVRQAANGPVVGSVGRIEREKGYDLLVRALVELPDIVAVLVGTGRSAEPLRALAEELGVSDRLIMTGWVQDSLEHIAGFDLFVLPSRTEGFPLTVLEAMQLGVPVVATDVGGVSESVVDGETGLLIPPDDVASLVAAIRRGVDDQELRSRVVEEAQLRCRTVFSPARMASAYEELYREAAGLDASDG